MTEDYYKILNVEKTASTEEIARSYRKLALKWHPDRNPGNPEAEAQFKLINEANEVLTDPHRRQLYDQFGKEGLQNGPAPGNPMDLFAKMFGGMNPFASQKRYDKVVQIQMEICLEDIYTGFHGEKQIPVESICSLCEMYKKSCNHCQGRGVHLMTRQMGPIILQQPVPCNHCHGQKFVIENPHCNLCHGKGLVMTEKTLNIKIDPGHEYGQPIEIPEKDILYVIIPVPDKNDIYKRHGRDLVYEKKLSLIEALSGVDIELKLPSGQTNRYRCNGIIQPETYRRIRRSGLPSSNGYGDLIIEFKIDLTVSPNELEMIQTIFSNYQLDPNIHDKIIVSEE